MALRPMAEVRGHVCRIAAPRLGGVTGSTRDAQGARPSLKPGSIRCVSQAWRLGGEDGLIRLFYRSSPGATRAARAVQAALSGGE
jgi:hypothetical protein